MMTGRCLAFLLALYTVGLCPVAAENNLTTTPPLPAKTPPATHKPKAVAHPKTPDLSELDKKPAPTTIPMDFSGMAKRPVDLPSEVNPPNKTDESGQFKPGINSNSNGGFSPGMNLNF
jgi:hypothetical protein